MLKQCSWCRKISVITKTGRKEWVIPSKSINNVQNLVSHGICESCLEIHFPEALNHLIKVKKYQRMG